MTLSNSSVSQPELSVQTRNTLRIVYLLTISTWATIAFYLYVGLRDGVWQALAVAIILAAAGLSAPFMIRLTKQGKTDPVIKFTIGVVLISVLLSSMLIADIGLICGLLLISLIFSMTAQSIQPHMLRQVVMASVVVSILIGLIDVWQPPTQYRLPGSDTWTLLFVSLVIVFCTVTMIRQFKHFSLYTRLTIIVYLAIWLPLSGMILLNDQTTARRLPPNIEEPSGATSSTVTPSNPTPSDRTNHVATAALDTQPWTVAFFQPEEVFLAPIHQQSRTSIFLIILGSALAALVGMIIAQRVSDPIMRLTLTAAQRATELATLQHVSLSLTENLELRAVLTAILNASVTLLAGTHDAQIFLYDDATDHLTFGAAMGSNGPAHQPAVEPRPDGLIYTIARSGQMHIIDDLSQHPSFGKTGLNWSGMSVTVPLNIDQHVVGVMSIFHTQLSGISKHGMHILQLLADQAAIAINNARLYESVKQRAAELETLCRASLSLTGNLELQTVLDAILKATLDFLNGSLNAHIFLYDATRDLLTFGAVLWTDGANDKPFAEPRRNGLTYRVAHQGEPLLIADMHTDPIYHDTPSGWSGSMLGLPLKIGQRVVGVMNAYHPQPHGIAQASLRVVRLLADQAAIAIENAHLYAEANRLRTFNENIVQHLDEGIVIVDPRQHITFVNSGTSHMLGYDKSELIGKAAQDIVALDHREQVNREFAKRSHGMSGRYESILITKDGQRIPVILSAQPLFEEGRFDSVLVVLTDISKRIQAEQALRESEAKLRAIVDNTNDVIYIKDREGRYILVNPAGRLSTGLKHQEIIGKTDQELWTIERLSKFGTSDRRVLQNGQPLTFEWLFDPDGARRFYLSTKYPYLSDDGEVIGVVGISRDITELKQTENSLHQSQKLESLGILAGGVAHDFSNLLVAILGQTSLLQHKLPADSPYRTHIDKAVKAAERAATLAAKMLAYSGRGHFEVRPLNLNELIEENLHLFTATISKATQLQVDLMHDLPLIDADAGEMQQVIMNLILNATEAMDEKPGTIEVSTNVVQLSQDDPRLQTVTGEALPPGQYILLRIRDTGIGMDAETLTRIFDPFFTTKFTGRGLGLSAVLGIVRGHKGGLQVGSTMGEGTVFELLFPINAVNAVVDEGAPLMQSDQQHSNTVLVIDDEAPVREAITDILEMEGLHVLTATDGESGIAIYRQHPAQIDVILLDHSMPGMNGQETLRQLKQLNPNVQVILSSGYRQEDITAEFESDGMVGFIQKPYSASMLIHVVHQHIHQLPSDHSNHIHSN